MLRCHRLVSLVALFPACSGLKLADRASNDTTVGGNQTDCYTRYEHRYLLKFRACTPHLANATKLSTANRSCMCLGVKGELLEPFDDCCINAPMMCDMNVANAFLKQYGENVSVVSDNAGEFYRLHSGKQHDYAPTNISGSNFWGQLDFYANWRDLDSQERRVAQMVEMSRGHAKRELIGHSYENRSIWAVRFTGPGYKEGGTKILLTFQLHAREWIAGMSGVYITERLVKQMKDDPSWLSGIEIVVVPLVNPDGFVYSGTTDRMWRKNMHRYTEERSKYCMGVDLNRNFPVDWNGTGSTSQSRCSDVYVGTGPASEPEAQAVKSMIDESPLTLHIDYHSYSEIFLVPWSYKAAPHPSRAKIVEFTKTLANSIRSFSGKQYSVGGNEILYRASGVVPDYSTSKGAWGITMELSPRVDFMGGGFLLPQAQIYPTIQDAWQTVLVAVAQLKAKQA